MSDLTSNNTGGRYMVNRARFRLLRIVVMVCGSCIAVDQILSWISIGSFGKRWKSHIVICGTDLCGVHWSTDFSLLKIYVYGLATCHLASLMIGCIKVSERYSLSGPITRVENTQAPTLERRNNVAYGRRRYLLRFHSYLEYLRNCTLLFAVHAKIPLHNLISNTSRLRRTFYRKRFMRNRSATAIATTTLPSQH